MAFTFKKLSIPEVILVETQSFSDERGYFFENYKESEFFVNEINVKFVQDNFSHSVKGVLRGLHYQKNSKAQAKFVTVLRGEIFDVAVDVRKGSPTYGQWLGEELSRENGKQLLIPKGFLHGFLTLMPETEVQYKCSDNYAPQSDGSVLWSSLGIDWPLPDGGLPKLSVKDERALSFKVFDSPFFWKNTV